MRKSLNLGLILVLCLFVMPSLVSAWLDGYDYRSQIDFTGVSAVTTQEVNLTKTANMLSNCSNIAFANSTDGLLNQTLRFCNDTIATFWVKVPNNLTIWEYHDTTGGSATGDFVDVMNNSIQDHGQTMGTKDTNIPDNYYEWNNITTGNKDMYLRGMGLAPSVSGMKKFAITDLVTGLNLSWNGTQTGLSYVWNNTLMLANHDYRLSMTYNAGALNMRTTVPTNIPNNNGYFTWMGANTFYNYIVIKNFSVSVKFGTGMGVSVGSEEVSGDSIYPQISIDYPLSQVYTLNVSRLNYTVSDNINLSSCWYSLDSGLTNTTITCGENLTDLTSVGGTNTWTVWANDTTNNVNSSSVTFTIPKLWFNTGYPSINNSFRISEFINVSGANFTLAGQQYRIIGSNFYYAIDYMTNLTYSDNGEEISNSDADVFEVLNEMKYLGVNVVRTWGLMQGGNNGTGTTNATWELNKTGGHYNLAETKYPGNFNETFFLAFDRFLFECSKRDIRPQITLINNWEAYGGMQWYLSMSSTSNKTYENATYLSDNWWTWHDQFFADAEANTYFQNAINYTLNRNNTYTGVLYKDDPTIFSWMIANEPRYKSNGSSHTVIAKWCNDTATYIKSIDTNHLVTCGIESLGFNETWGEGSDMISTHNNSVLDYVTFAMNTAQWAYMVERVETSIDNQFMCSVDTSTCDITNQKVRDFWAFGHNYTYNSRWTSGVPFWFPKQPRHSYDNWVEQNVKQANGLGMPVMLQEFVVPQGSLDIYKDEIYQNAISNFYLHGGDGIMFWTQNSDGYYRASSTSMTGNQDDGYGFYVSDNATLRTRSASTIKAFNFTKHNNTGGTSWVTSLNNYKYDFTLSINSPDDTIFNNYTLYLNISYSNSSSSGYYADQYNTSEILDNTEYILSKQFTSDSLGFDWYFRVCGSDFCNSSEISYIQLTSSTPSVALNNPASGTLIGLNPIEFNYTVTSTLETAFCEFYVDGGLDKTDTTVTNDIVQTFTENFSVSTNHTWYIKCTDIEDNVGTSETRNFTVGSPPVFDIYSPLNIYYNTLDVLVNFTADDYASLWYNFNGTNVTYTSPTIETFSEGSNTIYFYANNSVGILNTTSVTFYTDTIPPSVSIIYPASANYNITITSLNYTSSDLSLGSCWYSTDLGATNTTITCGDNVTGLTSTQGSNTWTVWANDTVNNIGSGTSTFLIDTILPNVTFVYQSPTDIDTFSIFTIGLNISYNISDLNLNISTIELLYKTNSSKSNSWVYINGSIVLSNYISSLNRSSTVTLMNTTGNYTWNLQDSEVYPGKYNYNEYLIENTAKSLVNLTTNQEFLKVRLFNISNDTQYNIFEIMASNMTASTGTLRIYYCNSSYVSGNPIGNSDCINFYNLPSSTTFNHTYNVSSHHSIPLAINTTTGMVGDIEVTSTSYFVMRGRQPGGWSFSYISNVSRLDTIQTSSNNGGTWSNFTGTIDAHLHQYDGKDTFHYYACAKDTFNNQQCSSVRSDLMELAGLPPIAPEVYSPTTNSYTDNININYTASESPNGYLISFYNISLVYENETFVQTINPDNSLNLSYIWDSNLAIDGTYLIRVEACDNLSQCSFGYSENFTIDSTILKVNLISPPSGSEDTDGIVIFEYNVTNTLRTISSCSLYLDNVLTDTDTTITKSIGQTFTVTGIKESDSLAWFISCTDDLGDNQNSTVYYLDTLLGGSGGGGGGSSGSTTYNTGISDIDEYLCGQTYEYLMDYGLVYYKIDELNDIIEVEKDLRYEWTTIRIYLDNWQNICSGAINRTLKPQEFCNSIYYFIVKNQYNYTTIDVINMLKDFKTENSLEVSPDLFDVYLNGNYDLCYSEGYTDVLPGKPTQILKILEQNLIFPSPLNCSLTINSSFFDLAIPIPVISLGNMTCGSIDTWRWLIKLSGDPGDVKWVGIKYWFIIFGAGIVGLIYILKILINLSRRTK